jgi:hypothetical protein
VTIAKNRVREDALNIVFGAHLGFPPDWRRRHACVFFNLEQLGSGGAPVSDDYIKLLRGSAVADYDAANIPAYAADAAEVPVLPFLHAPYLESAGTMPIAERPIDLLFFGSMNERRRLHQPHRSLRRRGVDVDHPYGEERDAYIRQSKAVLNCSFYETSRFEQARVFQCRRWEHRDLGTLSAAPRVHRLGVLITGRSRWRRSSRSTSAPGPCQQAGQKLASFAGTIRSRAMPTCCGLHAAISKPRHHATGHRHRRQPHINSARQGLQAGLAQLDVQDRAEPDAVLDIGRRLRCRWSREATADRSGRPPERSTGCMPTTCWSTCPT